MAPYAAGGAAATGRLAARHLWPGTVGLRLRFSRPPVLRRPMVIQTSRLVLRPCRDGDKPAFRAILNTPAMMARLGGVRGDAEIDALIDKRIRDQARYGHSYWAVELRDTGELIGTCGVRIADNYPGTSVEGCYEIGWRIAEAHWGRGFALEAAQASLDWTWENTPAPFVASWTTPTNVRSLNVMMRLRMQRARELDFPDARIEGVGSSDQLVVYVVNRPAGS